MSIEAAHGPEVPVHEWIECKWKPRRRRGPRIVEEVLQAPPAGWASHDTVHPRVADLARRTSLLGTVPVVQPETMRNQDVGPTLVQELQKMQKIPWLTSITHFQHFLHFLHRHKGEDLQPMPGPGRLASSQPRGSSKLHHSP